MNPESRAKRAAAPAPKSRNDQPVRHDEGKRDESAKPRKRGRANLERAHRTVTGMVEAVPGAPRSGSA